jgi:hypothetical protein
LRCQGVILLATRPAKIIDKVRERLKMIFSEFLYIFGSFWDVEIIIKIEKNRTKYVPEGSVSGYRGFYDALYQDLS